MRKKISEQFSAGGQPTSEDLKQLADEGFKSVVNLRSLDETGALVDEQQQAEAAVCNTSTCRCNPQKPMLN